MFAVSAKMGSVCHLSPVTLSAAWVLLQFQKPSLWNSGPYALGPWINFARNEPRCFFMVFISRASLCSPRLIQTMNCSNCSLETIALLAKEDKQISLVRIHFPRRAASGKSSDERRRKLITKIHANLVMRACISFLRCFRTSGTPTRKVLVYPGMQPCLVPQWPQIIQIRISF